MNYSINDGFTLLKLYSITVGENTTGRLKEEKSAEWPPPFLFSFLCCQNQRKENKNRKDKNEEKLLWAENVFTCCLHWQGWSVLKRKDFTGWNDKRMCNLRCLLLVVFVMKSSSCSSKFTSFIFTPSLLTQYYYLVSVMDYQLQLQKLLEEATLRSLLLLYA